MKRRFEGFQWIYLAVSQFFRYFATLKTEIMMKRILFLMLMVATWVSASAQTKKVSVLGDSYSTFIGVIPANYSSFYPNDRNDVTEVEQTWWSLYTKAAATLSRVWTVWVTLTSSSSSAAPTMLGPALPSVNTNTLTGRRKTAKVSALHWPA